LIIIKEHDKMKKLLLVILTSLSCSFLYAQQTPSETFKIQKQHWALSANAGYINVSSIRPAGPRYQSNGWSSLCVNYSVQNWSFGTWAGANYYINGKQPDLRLGFTITYTIKKW
jgi:hypothetical protein